MAGDRASKRGVSAMALRTSCSPPMNRVTGGVMRSWTIEPRLRLGTERRWTSTLAGYRVAIRPLTFSAQVGVALAITPSDREKKAGGSVAYTASCARGSAVGRAACGMRLGKKCVWGGGGSWETHLGAPQRWPRPGPGRPASLGQRLPFDGGGVEAGAWSPHQSPHPAQPTPSAPALGEKRSTSPHGWWAHNTAGPPRWPPGAPLAGGRRLDPWQAPRGKANVWCA